MKRTTLITAFLCLMSFTTFVACVKDNPKDNQENHQDDGSQGDNNQNDDNPKEPFESCETADGTDPGSFTIDGIDYVANNRASAAFVEGEELPIYLTWADEENSEKFIMLHLAIRKYSFNGPGYYSTRNGDGMIATVIMQGGFEGDGNYELFNLEISYLNMCIEEIDFDQRKVKGYFNAELEGTNDLVNLNLYMKITNGYFNIGN